MSLYPSKTKTFVFKDRDYTVSFPKTRDLLRIQALKVKLLRGEMGSIMDGDSLDGSYSIILADMIANFNICCPELLSSLNVETLEQLEALDSAVLVKVYIQEYLPWYSNWMQIIRNGGEVIKEERVVQEPEKQIKPETVENFEESEVTINED